MSRKIFLFLITLIFIVPASAGANVKPSFLYYLCNFDGVIHSNWAVVAVDKKRDEIYVLDPREQDIRIFNEKGMEIYHFGDDRSLGTMEDVAVEDDGNILVLSKKGSKTSVIRCNFRGERIYDFSLRNLPKEYVPFSPNHMAYRKGMIYLLDSLTMRLAIVDAGGGRYQNGYDLARMIDVEDSKRSETDVGGFSVDREGNILFTVPVFFSAYRLSPKGNIQGFGRPGSAPGRFGVVGDIDSDEKGNLYIADRLKCVVLVFSKDLQFKTEFGYRGPREDNLIGPKNLALDSRNRLYISQLAGRGISVFQLYYQQSKTNSE